MNFCKKFIGKASKEDKRPNGSRGEIQLSVVGGQTASRPRIWAIGGGKGGVGKSFVTVNLAVALSKLGKKVLLVDADLGAANLHTFLGIAGSKLSLSSFLKSKVAHIGPIICETGLPNLSLVSGAKDSLDVADIEQSCIQRLSEELSRVDYDYILLDIGPGTSTNVLEMFLIADQGIILTTPQPISVENTYRFLKCIFLHRTKENIDAPEDSPIKDALKIIFNGERSKRIKTVADILFHIKRLCHQDEDALQLFMGDTSLSILVNQVTKPEYRGIGVLIQKACHDYFNIEVGYLGDISHDNLVEESIRLRQPLSEHYSKSEAYRGIQACLQALLRYEQEEDIAEANL